MKSSPHTQRLYSLDALRGFDMFWIMGAEHIFHQLAHITQAPIWMTLSNQFKHPDWHGFAFYDLIFPLFLFLAGVSTPFSIGKQLEKEVPKKALMKRIIKRGLTLVLLGIIYNNGLELKPFSELRFGSVLGRIGLAYLFANLIYLYAKPKTQLIWFVGILIGYWFLLLFGARPNHQMGDLTMEGNIVSYLDTLLMPGKLYLGIHDPEGLVSTIPAISTALLGIFTGNLLKNTRLEERTKTAVILCVLGILFLSIAQIWNLVFPINKNLWTSSFTLYCGGLSLLLMALFYYLIDVRGHRKWAFFFKVIGMNSIFIYMSVVFIDWGFTANKLFAWLGQLVGAPYSSVVLIMASLVVQWGCLYFLYRRKYFLRV